MEVFFEIPEFSGNTTVAIGTFDGVHLGHKVVLETACKMAKNDNTPMIIFTFKDHPAIITGSKQVPQLITLSNEKLELLEKINPDKCIIIEFTKELSLLSPEQFIQDILINKLKAKNICVGFNFYFGYKASGNGQTLIDLSSKYNYKANVIEPVKVDNETISSSVIRELINNGEIEKSNKLLGYKYQISGKVVRGRGVGKSVLGIPTANMDVNARKLIPENGVYSCDVFVKDEIKKGIVNIGNRPTFDNGLKTVETHIIDFDQDIYDEIIKIELKTFLRREKKFNGIDELKTQILADIEKAKG
ncbi:MAG: bifunctional riboflavin kinase/FAD synthetase [Candidatus Sericytochromatia bacterium]